MPLRPEIEAARLAARTAAAHASMADAVKDALDQAAGLAADDLDETDADLIAESLLNLMTMMTCRRRSDRAADECLATIDDGCRQMIRPDIGGRDLMPVEKTMEKIVALAKNRGFVYPGSEIYGGLANSWDYGPLGVLLKNNVKAAWWQKFVQESPYNVGVDCAILMNPQVWVASGHVGGFTDPLIDCRQCKTRHRADKLIEDYNRATGIEMTVDGWNNEQLMAYIKENNIPCPACGSHDFTDIRKFNLMFKTFQGVTEDSKAEIYLRPETAQGIFVNFKNVQRTTRRKIPFGICQIGKVLPQ